MNRNPQNFDLEIITGERVRLVGKNGGSKSTLLRLLAGHEIPTSGSIIRKRNLTIGYPIQKVNAAQSQQTIFEVVSTASSELSQLPARLRELEAQMADPIIANDTTRHAYGTRIDRVWKSPGAL